MVEKQDRGLKKENIQNNRDKTFFLVICVSSLRKKIAINGSGQDSGTSFVKCNSCYLLLPSYFILRILLLSLWRQVLGFMIDKAYKVALLRVNLDALCQTMIGVYMLLDIFSYPFLAVVNSDS